MGRRSASSCARNSQRTAKLFRVFKRLSPVRRQKQPSHPSSLKALAVKATRASFFACPPSATRGGDSVRKLLDSLWPEPHEPLRPVIVRFKISRHAPLPITVHFVLFVRTRWHLDRGEVPDRGQR